MSRLIVSNFDRTGADEALGFESIDGKNAWALRPSWRRRVLPRPARHGRSLLLGRPRIDSPPLPTAGGDTDP
jgi:hypothetical protein